MSHDSEKGFDSKIIGYLCNGSHSVFFFEALYFAGLSSKEKDWGKRNSLKPARLTRRWETA